jgi:UDP:flavonoid glycosyltransferase YjiC (YdhE family)
VRLLFTFAGGWGHLDPLVPIATAAKAAGHEVLFAGRPWMVPKVQALGFTCFPAGSDDGLTPKRVPLETSVANEKRWAAGGFGLRIPRERSPGLLRLCEIGQPDLLIWEETDLAGGLVAERLGILHARVLEIAEGSFLGPGVLAEPLRALRAEQGLPPDPELVMLSRYLVLSPAPPSFRSPACPLPATAHAIRPGGSGAPSEADLPEWVARLPTVPTVYLTLGTVFPLESGDLFARVIAGVRELPVNLIVTVGDDFEPAELGPQPANVHLERRIPQHALLPRCDIVVSHGGSGSVIGALAHGLPLVVIPMGADQPLNAARCEALGVGRVLDALTATPASVRGAVRAVLAEPSFRSAARAIQEETAGLPEPSHAVGLLERLAVEQRPAPPGPT